MRLKKIARVYRRVDTGLKLGAICALTFYLPSLYCPVISTCWYHDKCTRQCSTEVIISLCCDSLLEDRKKIWVWLCLEG